MIESIASQSSVSGIPVDMLVALDSPSLGHSTEREAESADSQRVEPSVGRREAAAVNKLGSLVDEHADSMTLHTLDGYRLFMGRARDPGGAFEAIIGGKRVASALKSLWMLTASDNPYADWALCRWEVNLATLNRELNAQIAKATAALEVMKARGLSYSVQRSSEPKVLDLGFRSPYGYGVAELVVSFDYFVRAVKTLHHKNLQDDDQTRLTLRDVTRVIRRHFNELAQFERYLLRPELHQLSRRDYLPGVAVDAGQRVEAATAILGPVPADVYAGRLAPKFSRRRQQLSPQERELLQAVSRELAQTEGAGAGAEAVEPDAVRLL